MPTVNFPHDNNCIVHVPYGWYSYDYSTRPAKEPYFRELITMLMNQKKIQGSIIDGGAFIGDNAIPWALNTTNKVYAIDPSKRNCEYMRELVRLNNITNLEVLEYALSDTEEILCTSHDLYHCSFKENKGDTQVQATSLDKLFSEDNSVGFLHLDIEGLEYKAIVGATALIERCKPIIAFEQHLLTDNYIELANYLTTFGYNVYIINEILEGCSHDCRNLIATPFSLDYVAIANVTRISNISYIDHIEACIRKADKYMSKCPKTILSLDGMSGKKTRHFYNNICSLPGTRYIEIGTWRGSTLCSAVYGNVVKGVAIDNWSYSSVDRDAFFTEFSKYSQGNNIKVIEKNSWDVVPEDMGMKFNVYMYDGDHERSSHCRALTHFISNMDDTFIYIVDDWNDKRVRDGTFDGIVQCALTVEYQREIFTSDDNSHGIPYGPASDWHNGISIFVLRKTHL